jgi:TolA-binding protein
MLAAANARASLEEIRKKSEEEKAVCQREREEMQQQVNRLREANASLEEIRVQQIDQINKLLNTEKMSAKQATQELDAERIGKEGVLQEHVDQQTKKRVSGRSKEQNAEPWAAAPPNKKQKQNMPGNACDADCVVEELKSLESPGDAPAILQIPIAVATRLAWVTAYTNALTTQCHLPLLS